MEEDSNFFSDTFFSSIKQDNVEIIREYLCNNMNVNHIIEPKYIPVCESSIVKSSPPILSLCAFYGAEMCVRLLVSSCCDVNLSDSLGVSYHFIEHLFIFVVLTVHIVFIRFYVNMG